MNECIYLDFNFQFRIPWVVLSNDRGLAMVVVDERV